MAVHTEATAGNCKLCVLPVHHSLGRARPHLVIVRQVCIPSVKLQCSSSPLLRAVASEDQATVSDMYFHAWHGWGERLQVALPAVTMLVKPSSATWLILCNPNWQFLHAGSVSVKPPKLARVRWIVAPVLPTCTFLAPTTHRQCRQLIFQHFSLIRGFILAEGCR